MPFRIIPLVTGEIYHVVNRGVAGQTIFPDTRSYQRFLQPLDYYQYLEAPGKFSSFLALNRDGREKVRQQLLKSGRRLVEIIAYCLMPNHFHLLLRQTADQGIYQLMKKICISYSRSFNRRADRYGPLLQGVFKAVRVESEEQLLHVIRYIHINPYVGMVVKKEALASYPWSSLPDYLGKGGGPVYLVKEKLIKTGRGYLTEIMAEAEDKRRIKAMERLNLE